jgi:hypothetical protein
MKFSRHDVMMAKGCTAAPIQPRSKAPGLSLPEVVLRSANAKELTVTISPEPHQVDHRDINRDLDVFTTDPLVGSGLPLWRGARRIQERTLACVAGTVDTRLMKSPEAVVDEQVAAYNSHDLDRFVATYADDVEVVAPDGRVLRGHDALRQTYGPLFENGTVQAEIVGRLRCADWVVDHERASVSGRDPVEVLVAYRVSVGRIVSVRMLG